MKLRFAPALFALVGMMLATIAGGFQRPSIDLPDPAKTPGAVLPVTAKDVCVAGYSKKVRNVPAAVKRQVYASYGIKQNDPNDPNKPYEVDHLISLELGGSNSIKNLWPQSYVTQPWNAHRKDALENRLHKLVCDGTMDLAEAQKEISGNWIEAYKKYIDPLK